MLCLLGDLGGQTLQLPLGPIDLGMDLSAGEGIEGDRGADQAPVLPARDRHHDLQIPPQLGEERRGRIRGGLPLHFQEQLGVGENPLPHRRRGVSPSGIQLPGFPSGEPVLHKGFRQAEAVLGAGTRHGHQEFHGHMGRECTRTDLLLHTFREQLHQCQVVCHPTHATIKSPRQLFQAEAEPLLEFGQQPALFQRAVAFRPTQRAIQHQRFGFRQRPDQGLDRVSAELFQGPEALIAVDDDIAAGLAGHPDHDDGRLLSDGGQRGQQLSLPGRMARAQKFITAVQLMKLQLHPDSPRGRLCG